ncbi:MAG: hypothetical protein LBD86_00045 [Spirochaetaceae bacterium]|nr:hypothetical protein [Spirochaetaceae bacterium]
MFDRMRELYDTPIGGIPPDYHVDDSFSGPYRTMLRSGVEPGLAMRRYPPGHPSPAR